MAGLALRLPLVVRLWRRQSLRSRSWPRLLFHPAAPGGAAWTAERRGVAALPPGTLRHVPLLARSASSWAAAAESSRKEPGDPQGTERPPAAGPDEREVSDAKRLLALAYPERWKLSGISSPGLAASASALGLQSALPSRAGRLVDCFYSCHVPVPSPRTRNRFPQVARKRC